ncbi:hypothetical protein FF1_035570 [Malus domestica]
MIPTTPPRTLRSIFTLGRRRNPSPLAQQFMPSPHLSSSPSSLLNAVADCSLLDTLKVGQAASKTLTPPDYLCPHQNQHLHHHRLIVVLPSFSNKYSEVDSPSSEKLSLIWCSNVFNIGLISLAAMCKMLKSLDLHDCYFGNQGLAAEEQAANGDPFLCDGRHCNR